MQKSFDAFKQKLITAPVLAYLDYQKAFLFCTDASGKDIGAVLSQLDDNGREHPTHYSSRVISDTESKFSVFESEELVLMFAVKKFRHYLISDKFKLCTDHQALKYIFNMEDPHGLIALWFTLLAEYNFEISYQGGKNNASADYLSRPIRINLVMSNAEIESVVKLVWFSGSKFVKSPVLMWLRLTVYGIRTLERMR